MAIVKKNKANRQKLDLTWHSPDVSGNGGTAKAFID